MVEELHERTVSSLKCGIQQKQCDIAVSLLCATSGGTAIWADLRKVVLMVLLEEV